MVNLFGVLGTSTPEYLEAGNGKAIAVSMEPGHGTVKHGTVLYRKSDSVLFAPAAAVNISDDNCLVILREDVDTDASATVAAAAGAYINGEMLADHVVLSDGVTTLTAAQAHVLRKQGFVLYPLDNLKAENASPSSGTKGTEVTLTATPSSDYEFDTWEVVSGGVTIEDNKFTIGDKAVTVKAKFKATA